MKGAYGRKTTHPSKAKETPKPYRQKQDRKAFLKMDCKARIF
jgi:hypothetical protein